MSAEKQIIEQRVNQLENLERFLYKVFIIQIKLFGITPKMRFNPYNPLTYLFLLALAVYGIWFYTVEHLIPELKELFTYTYSK